MDTLQTLGAVLGIGFLSGIRLYATVLALGIVLRMHWFSLPANLAHMNVFAEPWVMIAAGTGCVAEFLADKIPWVDSIWDGVHSVIRPVGAALIASQMLGTEDPAIRTAFALLSGGVAFAGHSSKAATRLVANHSPEPVSNVALSVAEDMFLPFGIWMTFQHPLITCVFVGCFLALFAWLAPKVFRMLNIEWIALRAVLRRHFGAPAEPVSTQEGQRLSDDIQSRLVPLPRAYAEALGGRIQADAGVFCSAARNVPRLKSSVGYLCFDGRKVYFVAKRMLRYRVFEVPEYSAAAIEKRLLVDSLTFETAEGTVTFDVFKVRKPARISSRPALSHS